MPLIRYSVGDLFDGICKWQRCSCGSELQYFTKLHGRFTDLVQLPNGKIVSPVTLFGGTTLRKFRDIVKHQTLWNGEYFVVLCEVGRPYADSEVLKLQSALACELSDYDVNFKVKFVEKIPEEHGKFRYFKVAYEAR
jgi:hypothetical protein